MWAEADRVLAVGLRRDVGPGAPFVDHLAYPVGVIGLVGQQHLARLHVVQEITGNRGVVLLAGGDRQTHGQAVFVGYSMDFRSKTAPASSETTIRVAFFKVAAE